MGEIKITIENCNNISHGELTLEENKLNIKYGMNGTGKSSLSTAISLISQGKDLTELKPFGSGDEVVPTINLSKNIRVVKVFNEEFVNNMVFKESKVIDNAFDVFIRTPDYEQKRAELDSRLTKLKVDIDTKPQIIQLKGDISAFMGKLELNATDVKNGSKGDFIFREDVDGIEFISIMFEMKNEMDETATKHKNEDFFKELDRDRREKGCEYAVLVSLLEIDNELYNNGIVDVSYKYEKMYVIRPQFFIPMITLLRNAALNSLKYRQELELVRNQQIDILRFEENMNTFKDGFTRNYRIASEKFKTAIDEIDKTISHLQKTKEALLSSENQLRLANNKAEDLSIKKLTKDAPAVKEMFDKVSNNKNIE